MARANKAKMLDAIEFKLLNPTATQAQVAEIIGITDRQLHYSRQTLHRIHNKALEQFTRLYFCSNLSGREIYHSRKLYRKA